MSQLPATLLFAFSVLAGPQAIRAQSAVEAGDRLPRFDVVSLRKAQLPVVVPGAGGAYSVGLRIDPGGFVRCSYCSVGTMIEMAWDAKPYQVTGPDWIQQDTFEVEARVPPGTPTSTVLQMLRSLLLDRFHLRLSVEERTTKVLALTVSGKGVKLRRTEEPATSVGGGTYSVISSAMSMGDLAQRLSRRLEKPVIDKTGLDGRFGVSLTWKPDSEEGTATDSLFRALRDELGLEITSQNAPIQSYVVIGASRTPTEN